MGFNPYFYYCHKSGPGRSADGSVSSPGKDGTEINNENSSVDNHLEHDTPKNKQAVGSAIEPDSFETLKAKHFWENSRFREVAPGIFQFKHARPDAMFMEPRLPVANHYSPENMLLPQADKSPELNGFVKVGVFSGRGTSNKYSMPVYQFT